MLVMSLQSESLWYANKKFIESNKLNISNSIDVAEVIYGSRVYQSVLALIRN